MSDAASACVATGAVAGSAIAVECVRLFLGIPVEVVYTAVAGAFVGLSTRRKEDWHSMAITSYTVAGWSVFLLKVVYLMMMVSGNALVSAWTVQFAVWVVELKGLLPPGKVIAVSTQAVVSGVLAWASIHFVPTIVRAIWPVVIDGIKEWIKGRLR